MPFPPLPLVTYSVLWKIVSPRKLLSLPGLSAGYPRDVTSKFPDHVDVRRDGWRLVWKQQLHPGRVGEIETHLRRLELGRVEPAVVIVARQVIQLVRLDGGASVVAAVSVAFRDLHVTIRIHLRDRPVVSRNDRVGRINDAR